MKKIFVLIFLLSQMLEMSAQAQFITCSRYPDGDVDIDNLDYAGGFILISKMSDLVLTHSGRDAGKKKRKDGMYEYRVISPVDNRNLKIEVRRRGDVSSDFITDTAPKNGWIAYNVDYAERPIKENRQKDRVLDKGIVGIDFISSISDLEIGCKEILNRGGKITTSSRDGVTIKELRFPYSILENARRDTMLTHQNLLSKCDELNNKKDYDAIDALENEWEEKKEFLKKLQFICISATGTNAIHIDLSEMKNQERWAYGILLLNKTEKVHVSKCAGFLEEGSKLYENREYKAAREAFVNAISAEDATAELKSSLQTQIAYCDTCQKYDRLAGVALSRMKRMKEANNSTQAEVAECAALAQEYIKLLYVYNSIDFYDDRIKRLDELIDFIPLDMRFTIMRWENSYSGFYEGGAMPNVEIWAYYSDSGTTPNPNDYASEKKFNNLMSIKGCKNIGESDFNGEIDLHLNRKKLPTGLFFHPIGYSEKVKIKYLDMENVIQQSKGTYNKRQFRMRMFIEK